MMALLFEENASVDIFNLGIAVGNSDDFYLENVSPNMREIHSLNIRAERLLQTTLPQIFGDGYDEWYQRRIFPYIRQLEALPVIRATQGSPKETTDWPHDNLGSAKNYFFMLQENCVGGMERLIEKIAYYRGVNWDAESIRRDSFDYVPGDRPIPKKGKGSFLGKLF